MSTTPHSNVGATIRALAAGDSVTHAEIFGTTSVHCPDWCERPEGHGYESADEDGEYRIHELEIGSVPMPRLGSDGKLLQLQAVTVYLEASETHSGETTTHHDPLVRLDAQGVELSSDEARDLAAALLAAADRCDEVVPA